MNVMIDIETLATWEHAAIASVAAVIFNNKGIQEMYHCRAECMKDDQRGAIQDADTIQWWEKQSPEARQELSGKIELGYILNKLTDFLLYYAKEQSIIVWANSPSFDCNILRSAMHRYQITCPWQFWHERDYRTILALAKQKGIARHLTERENPPHFAINDAIDQARILLNALNYLMIPLENV